MNKLLNISWIALFLFISSCTANNTTKPEDFNFQNNDYFWFKKESRKYSTYRILTVEDYQVFHSSNSHKLPNGKSNTFIYARGVEKKCNEKCVRESLITFGNEQEKKCLLEGSLINLYLSKTKFKEIYDIFLNEKHIEIIVGVKNCKDSNSYIVSRPRSANIK